MQRASALAYGSLSKATFCPVNDLEHTSGKASLI